MLDKIKSLLTKYKVHVSVVGGALVIATVYGQCTLEPNVEAVEEAVEEAAEEAATEAASNAETKAEVVEADAAILGEEENNVEADNTEATTTENAAEAEEN